MAQLNPCPYQEREILTACALRFNGWQYVEEQQFDHRQAIQSFFETATWQLSQHEQLAVFFLLQRGLAKWDLVYESERGKFWRAYRSLFLRVYQYEIPSEYEILDYVQRWQQNFIPHLEECVARIRQIHETIAYDDNAPREIG
jgi:hypothetical protein